MGAEGSKKASGLFITFEGGDGAGKTTHLGFLAEALKGLGYDVLCLREPGGTRIGEDLRAVVLDAKNGMMVDEAELLVYEAARAQLVGEVIAPALAQGRIVLCDRFADSTIAYQVYGRGLDASFVQAANGFACQGVYPARTILMTTGSSADDVAAGLERATENAQADRLEMAGLDFHEAVRAGYGRIAEDNPERIRIVRSDTSIPETARSVFEAVADLFGWDDFDSVFGVDYFDTLAVQTSSRDSAGDVI